MRSTRVDGRPEGIGPVAMYRATPGPNAWRAAAIVVLAGSPWRFADVHVIGPTSWARARATGWSGTRTPTVPLSPRIGAGNRSRALGEAGSSTVTGPGKSRRIQPRDRSVNRAHGSISSVEETAMEIGWSDGRAFASIRRATAVFTECFTPAFV